MSEELPLTSAQRNRPRVHLDPMGWFTPPFDTANDVRQRLEPYYEILDFHVEGAMLYYISKPKRDNNIF